MTPITLLALPLLLTGCSDVQEPDHAGGHTHGVTTTAVLYFTPEDGGETLSFSWSDPENDGEPIIDDILLPDASDHNHHDTMTYTLDVELWNDLEDPVEDVTPEIESMADEHQFFFTGSAVESSATGDNDDAIIEQEYADSDADGLPLGLSSTITTLDWGSGALTVTLRHMPAEDGEAVKVEGLAEDVAEDGFGAIGGENDIEITFNIEVE